MNADIQTLYKSDFYRVLGFKCRCKDCRTSETEYGNSFDISFVRKGNFVFNVFRHSLDSYNGCVLVNKPGFERTITHVHTVPDECTILDFTMNFYKELVEQFKEVDFFLNDDRHSALIKTTAETEFLHFQIIKLATAGAGKLEMDYWVMEVIKAVLPKISSYNPGNIITQRLKKNHLITIETAKEYITQHFTEDISLTDIAAACHVSPFHFSRVFKIFTSYAPYQFLLNVRLKHAEMLLKNTSMTVTDIAFLSGFNGIENFSAAFRYKYQHSPEKYRNTNRVTFNQF